VRVPTCFRHIDRFSVALGDVRETTAKIDSDSIQCIVTSPPFYQMRDYEVEGQLGLEKTPEEYIENQVAVFREARRILRPDGTLWLNLGDAYATSSKGSGGDGRSSSLAGDGRSDEAKSKNRRQARDRQSHRVSRIVSGVGHKNLFGMPWRLAFALQKDGWILRSEIIWSKLNPMPESCRDRPSRAHEHIFLLSKDRRYYYDGFGDPESTVYGDPGDVRPRRTVWEIGTQKSYARHFAMFPIKLPERCFSIGASQFGCCPSCRSPYRRIVEKKRIPTRPGKTSHAYKPGNWAANGVDHDSKIAMLDRNAVRGNRDPERHTTKNILAGWAPGCSCDAGDVVPCLVADIYHGAGRSLVAADRLSMDYIGFELNEKCIMDTIIELEADRKKRSKGKPRKRRVAKPFVQVPLIEEKPEC
jgi:site-specific DNA-methyltransferase (cytosine-N4-specific)